MDFGFDVISAQEYDRQRVLYEPLTAAIRKLIDAGIHTEVDEATARDAQAAVEAVTAILESKRRTVTTTLRHETTGRPLAWANPAVGLRNAIAPPMEIHHTDDGRCWSEFTLSTGYEGPPGWVHGGICALVLLYENTIVAGGDLARVPAAFAQSNGLLAIVFLAFVLAEVTL